MWEPKGEFGTFGLDHVRKPLVSLGRDAVREELTRRPPIVRVDHLLDDIREGIRTEPMFLAVLDRLLEYVAIGKHGVVLAFLKYLVGFSLLERRLVLNIILPV